MQLSKAFHLLAKLSLHLLERLHQDLVSLLQSWMDDITHKIRSRVASCKSVCLCKLGSSAQDVDSSINVISILDKDLSCLGMASSRAQVVWYELGLIICLPVTLSTHAAIASFDCCNCCASVNSSRQACAFSYALSAFSDLPPRE